MPKFRPVLSSIILSCSLFLFACSPGLYGTKIELRSFTPALNANLSDYKGKKIYLMNFDNRAQNTSIWYYYSPDMKFTYGGDSLIHNYFWYSFENALVNIGMIVSNTSAPNPLAPAMWLRLKSITEDRFQVQVNLLKQQTPILMKLYVIDGERLAEAQGSPDVLEKRAYDMTNRLIETVLTDPEFKNAFLAAADEMSGKK